MSLEAITNATTRFDTGGADLADTRSFFASLGRQLLIDGFRSEGLARELGPAGKAWGCVASYRKEGQQYDAYYVYAPHRGKKRLAEYVFEQGAGRRVLVTPAMQSMLKDELVELSPVCDFVKCAEYRAIDKHYGMRRAHRSGVLYMSHIDEGLAVLNRIDASLRARKAYCLHPLLQSDSDLAQAFPRLPQLSPDVRVVALAMEYRRIANMTLSSREIVSPNEIPLGPLPDVKCMLVADKVQNYKDFLVHQKGRHPRSDKIEGYFRFWLSRLGVTDEEFQAHRQFLS